MSRRQVVVFIGIAGAGLLAVSAAGWFAGLRINLTPSEPLGLWRIVSVKRPVARDDLVFVCPPPTAVFALAFERGYLRRGLCPGGFAPLIKTVAALPGQRIEVAGNVVIDGAALTHSAVRARDGADRPLEPFAGGIVPAGFVFLTSPYEASYDSRYFGPVPANGVLGLARPLLVFDP
ncbi:conjugative transfer signal peptidase TraF [Ensifer sp. ENS02]|uniref:conjugative transfer signal peptidase TraF n=1 Tax=Ensifer sp. ENS02 TaxID=2769290 RepID=UPI00177B9FE6|nr:conjugative transfer signal peptidase TraF [Ensifer sp. ENS02]